MKNFCLMAGPGLQIWYGEEVIWDKDSLELGMDVF